MGSNKKIISVIVAIKNEEKFIEKCLDSLIHQTFPKEKYQLIIVDGGSKDRTINIVKKYMKKYPRFIKLYHNPKEWQAAGRNIGIKKVKSEFIAYIDGHCKATKEWLENLYQSMKDTNDSLVAGIGSIHISPDDESVIGKAIGYVFDSELGGLGSSFRTTKKKTAVQHSSFLLYRRKALEQVNFYDEDLKIGEDFTLDYKLRKKGYKLYVEPNAIVHYYKRKSLLSFFRQMYKYGIAKAIIRKKYPDSLGITHILPSFLLVVILSLFLSCIYIKPFFFYFVVLIVLYLFAITGFSLLTAIKNKDIKLALLMPLLYLIEHFGYSYGFLRGMFKKRW